MAFLIVCSLNFLQQEVALGNADSWVPPTYSIQISCHGSMKYDFVTSSQAIMMTWKFKQSLAGGLVSLLCICMYLFGGLFVLKLIFNPLVLVSFPTISIFPEPWTRFRCAIFVSWHIQMTSIFSPAKSDTCLFACFAFSFLFLSTLSQAVYQEIYGLLSISLYWCFFLSE